jgi:5-methylcytosine-specific restriction endonuclease McrA
MKYQVLGNSFKTKKECLSYFRNQLLLFDKPKDKTYVELNEDTPIKKSETKNLYLNFINSDKKWKTYKFKNKDPQYWYIVFPAKQQRALGFRLTDKDKEILHKGISVVSYKKFTCFYSPTINLKQEENEAARYEIQNQTLIFKYNQEHLCTKCKKSFEYNELVVDHINEFDGIFKEWKENVSTVSELQKVESSYSKKFKDRELAKSWQDFHFNVAQLQLLCEPCHKEKHNK